MIKMTSFIFNRCFESYCGIVSEHIHSLKIRTDMRNKILQLIISLCLQYGDSVIVQRQCRQHH